MAKNSIDLHIRLCYLLRHSDTSSACVPAKTSEERISDDGYHGIEDWR